MCHAFPEDREVSCLNPRTLIIGAGNESRGDDAAGLLIVERLRRRKRSIPFSFLAFSGDAMEVAGSLAEFAAVLVFDAVVSGRAPGTIHVFEWLPGTRMAGFRNLSTHAFGIEQALELSAVLGVLPECVRFAGIEGGSFGVGDPLSPGVEAAIRSVSTDRFVMRCLSRASKRSGAGAQE